MTLYQESLIDKLTDKMQLDMQPEIVPVKTESFSRPLQCYSNVAEKIKIDGGKIHYGWSVHITDILCEAERHAVWENNDEELLCVTPNPSDKNEIIFLSDDRFVDPNEQIDNVRTNITNNPLVNDFIFICEAIGDLWNRFTSRKDDEQVIASTPVIETIDKYEQYKGLIYGLIVKGRKERSECFCGSGKKYLVCHSKTLKTIIPKEVKGLEEFLIKNGK